MKYFLVWLVLLLSTNCLYAQDEVWKKADSLVMQLHWRPGIQTKEISDFISEQFSSEEEKTRAAFVWIAKSFTYDIAYLTSKKKPETAEQKIQKILKSGKGVCENYARLFDVLCKQLGLKSYLITGYTRQYDKLDSIAHAWCAVKLNNEWFLFDPTWASGFMNSAYFIKSFNEQHYKVKPEIFLQTHMPFDPMMQFGNRLVRYEGFDSGNLLLRMKDVFSFETALQAYDSLERHSQIETELQRINANGEQNHLVREQTAFLQLELEQLRQQKLAKQYNQIVYSYNESVKQFNKCIAYRNRQFKPERSDEDLVHLYDVSKQLLKQVSDSLQALWGVSGNTKLPLAKLNKDILKMEERIRLQEGFIERYISTPKVSRKKLFLQH